MADETKEEVEIARVQQFPYAYARCRIMASGKVGYITKLSKGRGLVVVSVDGGGLVQTTLANIEQEV